jgi:hypothetical protein
VIVYHSQDLGLVAVDRNTVAISASDVMLSFAAFPIEIPGEVNFKEVKCMERHMVYLLGLICTLHSRWFFSILFTIMLLLLMTPRL